MSTPIGAALLSILFGVAIATLFQRPCEGNDCIEYQGPVLHAVNGSYMRYGTQCYQRSVESAMPDAQKKRVPAADSSMARSHFLRDAISTKTA